MRIPLALLVTSLLLSGCSSGGDDDPSIQETAGDGGSTPDDVTQQAAPAASAAPSVGHCQISRTAANTPYGAGLNVDAALFDDVYYCDFRKANDTFADFQAALVEVAWDGLQGSETEVRLRIDSSRCGMSVPVAQECNEGMATATVSPLRHEVDGDVLQRNLDEDLSAYVFATGLSLTHDFHVYITLFAGPIPVDYTAVPA